MEIKAGQIFTNPVDKGQGPKLEVLLVESGQAVVVGRYGSNLKSNVYEASYIAKNWIELKQDQFFTSGER